MQYPVSIDLASAPLTEAFRNLGFASQTFFGSYETIRQRVVDTAMGRSEEPIVALAAWTSAESPPIDGIPLTFNLATGELRRCNHIPGGIDPIAAHAQCCSDTPPAIEHGVALARIMPPHSDFASPLPHLPFGADSFQRFEQTLRERLTSEPQHAFWLAAAIPGFDHNDGHPSAFDIYRQDVSDAYQLLALNHIARDNSTMGSMSNVELARMRDLRDKHLATMSEAAKNHAQELQLSLARPESRERQPSKRLVATYETRLRAAMSATGTTTSTLQRMGDDVEGLFAISRTVFGSFINQVERLAKANPHLAADLCSFAFESTGAAHNIESNLGIRHRAPRDYTRMQRRIELRDAIRLPEEPDTVLHYEMLRNDVKNLERALRLAQPGGTSDIDAGVRTALTALYRTHATFDSSWFKSKQWMAEASRERYAFLPDRETVERTPTSLNAVVAPLSLAP